MFSGCRDSQTSADVSNVSQFQLPDPAGRSGGACTSALLQVLYKNKVANSNLSFVDVLTKMRGVLGESGFSQIPQLSSSRKMNIHDTFHIASPNSSGTRRALLIGINYVGQQGQLSGCHNDVDNIKEYILNVHGFQENNITVLMDDGNHTNPTKSNIMNAFAMLVQESEYGDSVFVHYSGHGGSVPDDNGDEEDGYDETLIPVDFRSAGQIRDDDIFSKFVAVMPAGVTVTCLMDCCHSGTILDLPYSFKADGESDEMAINNEFNVIKLAKMAAAIAPAVFTAARAAKGGDMSQCCSLGASLVSLLAAFQQMTTAQAQT